jgi:hypothetical protein
LKFQSAILRPTRSATVFQLTEARGLSSTYPNYNCTAVRHAALRCTSLRHLPPTSPRHRGFSPPPIELHSLLHDELHLTFPRRSAGPFPLWEWAHLLPQTNFVPHLTSLLKTPASQTHLSKIKHTLFLLSDQFARSAMMPRRPRTQPVSAKKLTTSTTMYSGKYNWITPTGE